jgi:hypothetical protein
LRPRVVPTHQAKRQRLLEAAQEEAEEALALRERLAAIGESKLAPEALLGEVLAYIYLY